MAARDKDDSVSVTRLLSFPDSSQAVRVQRAELKVVHGVDKGLAREIDHRGLLVGTAPECGLCLSDPSVSRHHGEIVLTAQGFELRDLDSKNGIFVGALRVRHGVLTSRQELVLGETRLRFRLLDKHDDHPLSASTSLGPLRGDSLPMRQVYTVLERAAQSDATLLIEGESGTGKELAARAVHQLSTRREHPLVLVDCGALSSTLAESELFGHRKGAFTGAAQDRVGAFEEAHQGTVFLDEIGELSLELQPKLLRLLESRELKRLGENLHRHTDVRLIAATHRDLDKEVEAGRLRQDLFYRLGVLRVRMPPLRERVGDIELLAVAFVEALRPDLDPREVIDPRVKRMLESYTWPGNVRELRNVIERLLLFPEDPEAALARTGAGADELRNLLTLPFHEARGIWTDRFERTYLTSVLDRHAGVVAQAASRADIPRQTFHRLMRKHGLTRS